MTTLTDNTLAIKVPEDATCFEVWENTNLVYYEGKPSFKNIRDKVLPAGDWSILGLASELTEEQAGEVVSVAKMYGYRNYQAKEYTGGSSPFDVWESYPYEKAVDSFRSLLRSHNLTPDNLLILKKK